MQTQFKKLGDVQTWLQNTPDLPRLAGSNWSLYKTLVHCAQTIEYSMTGYPKSKPRLIQNTIGKIVIAKFLKNDAMKHDLTAPVAGAPDIPDSGIVDEAKHRLLDAIKKFAAFEGTFARHLFFGALSKKQYDQYFTLHIKDHLSEFEPRS